MVGKGLVEQFTEDNAKLDNLISKKLMTRCPFKEGKRVEYASFMKEIHNNYVIKKLCDEIIDKDEKILDLVGKENTDNYKMADVLAAYQWECYLKIKELSWYYK